MTIKIRTRQARFIGHVMRTMMDEMFPSSAVRSQMFMSTSTSFTYPLQWSLTRGRGASLVACLHRAHRTAVRLATFLGWQSVFLPKIVVRIRINPYHYSDLPVKWPKLLRPYQNGFSTFFFIIAIILGPVNW